MDNPQQAVRLLERRIYQCRICRDGPCYGEALPQEPRPVLQLGASAPICIAGQAPGRRAHEHGQPFRDPSGVRLREWLNVTETQFYDPQRFAIVPMGFCFPGYDAQGGDRPPRGECAEAWRDEIFRTLPNLSLILVIGQYAQRYHLPPGKRGRTLTDTVANWRQLLNDSGSPAVLPLPHPSWRNNAWLRKNPWFEQDLLPVLRQQVASLID